ncbi:hypothetical protein Tco_0982210 [Tanacetum coccineum]
MFCQEYHIPDAVHPELPTPNQSIHDSPVEMDLFAFIRHADPTKVWIGERQIEEGQVPLLESIEGRVIPLAGRNEQGGQDDNVEVVWPHDLNEEGDDDVQAAATDKPKETRKKKKVAGGASGSNLPPKKLREDHGASGDAGASTAGKSLVALQGLLEHSTLAVELGVTKATTVLFVTSSVTLTPEREDDVHTVSVFGPNLLTQHPAERFVISLDSFHHSSTNAADAEVTSILKSLILPPLVITATVATTAVACTSSAPITGAGTGLAIQSLFADSASPSAARPDTAGPSDPCDTEISADTFYISQEIAEVKLRSEHNLRERKKLERKCARQTDLLKDKVIEIASLKAQLSLKEGEAAEAIRLRSQRNLALEGEKSTLEGQVATLESTAASKDIELVSVTTQIAKLNHDLSSLQLSFDELSIKDASLESQNDSLTDQVSGILQKDKNKAKMDKAGHGNRKSAKY